MLPFKNNKFTASTNIWDRARLKDENEFSLSVTKRKKTKEIEIKAFHVANHMLPYISETMYCSNKTNEINFSAKGRTELLRLS